MASMTDPNQHRSSSLACNGFAVSVPATLIIGNVMAGLYGGPAIPYLQKLFLLTALVLLAQIYFGHRLPPGGSARRQCS